MATVLVQKGTLKVGDVFVAGAEWGRVRALVDDRGEKVSRVRQIVDWLGRDFDGVIIFDESHAMQNAGGGKGERGNGKQDGLFHGFIAD